MNDITIRAEGISKKYRIGQKERYRSIRDVIANFLKLSYYKKEKTYIWALRDVSFQVKKGEVVGIIGRNGAGKTTLLRILSRITEPTEGYAEIRGRVGSLLEVGTGFHPELTGRENIYLNGSILGMKKREIDKKFDQIVEFAEIEKFIDTSVKYYSSGMYVRLAFSVAAHLEPEILLVDEVLAVGDVTFQKKCLGKMGNVAKEGKTILFVSHNMAAINQLCKKVIWIDEGYIKMIGPTENLVRSYLSSGNEVEGERQWKNLENAPGNEKIRLRAIRVLNSEGKVTSTVDIQFPFYIEIEYDIFQPSLGIQVGFWLLTQDGVVIFVAGDNEDTRWIEKIRNPGRYKSVCKIPGFLLNSGTYFVTVASDFRNIELLFVEERAIMFRVELTQVPAHSHTRSMGIICPSLEWKIYKT